MIKFTDWSGNIQTLKVQTVKYAEGDQLAVVSLDMDDDESMYSVVTRNLPEYHALLGPNQTFIPLNADEHKLTEALVEEGVLLPTDIVLPYNFHTVQVFDICMDRVDEVVTNED